MHEVRPGEILLGKYRVEEVIGIGGMGRVLKAAHLYLQQPVAIKILLPQMAENQDTVARFLREAQSTVRLRSEHIARVMDVGTMHDGTPFMVMEFLEGHDLNQILRHHGPQNPNAVVDLVLQACEGMAEAHSLGIVHRDIKPSNFFVTRRPDGSDLLKILDFGISKTGGEVSELTGTQTVIGTPTYMAPEQMVSARTTDPRSDIWSIGVVMYQMLAGRPPFESETYAQLVISVSRDAPAPLHVQLPPGLGDIVMRCLEKDPNRRIQNVGDLARMLAAYASDPMVAQQSAERASRILSGGRPSVGVMPFGGPSGMGLPHTPQALTPRSWNQTGGSSLSGGAGQIGGTKVVRGGRGLLIGGVAALCIAAGVGGFLISHGMKSTPAAAAQTPPAAATTTEAKTTPAPTPTTAPTPTAVTTPTAATTPAAVTTPSTPTASTPTVTTTAPSTSSTKTATTTPTTTATSTKADPKSASTSTKSTSTSTSTKSTSTSTPTKSSSTSTASKSTSTPTKSTSTSTASKSTATATKSTATSTKSSTTTKSTSKSTGTKKKGDSLFDDRN